MTRELTEYEVLCDETLRNLEDHVRALRYDAAVGGSSSDAARMLRHQEAELSKLRLHIIHTIPDPAIARAIIHNKW